MLDRHGKSGKGKIIMIRVKAFPYFGFNLRAFEGYVYEEVLHFDWVFKGVWFDV